MTQLTKNTLFKVYDSKPETPMDKTARVVRQWWTMKRKNVMPRIPACAVRATLWLATGDRVALKPATAGVLLPSHRGVLEGSIHDKPRADQ